ncbi:MAG: hypothetical protein WBA63_03010 [Thermomicrobiales bacterium]
MNPVPPFPSATSITHLRVYDWATRDGSAGGSPHVHLASAEAYVPTRGAGAVEILTRDGASMVPLTVGAVVWFEPGTIHRLHNRSGDLELLVVMQNAGLPEAGDAVLTFPAEMLASGQAYETASTLEPGTDGVRLESARRRRDAAIEGYLALRERVNAGDIAALEDFLMRAVALKRDRLAAWRETWERGPLHEAMRTGERLAALAAGDIHDLLASRHAALDLGNAHTGVGMCGRLDAFLPEGVASPH